ncbi:TATA-binding protein-associated phosphoprotein [Entamoeba marina]
MIQLDQHQPLDDDILALSTPKMNFRNQRNYQTAQQAILIALLNEQCDITIRRPVKRCVVKSLCLINLLKKRCKEREKHDIGVGVSKKTAIRRYETNRITEGLHLLMDILFTQKYFFNTRKTRGKKGVIKSEAMQEIFFNEHFLMNKDDIQKKGDEINQIITEKVLKEQTMYLISKQTLQLQNTKMLL